MSGQVRFQVSKTGDESGQQQNGAEMDLVDLNGPKQQSYGSLPSTSVNDIQPTISVTGSDGVRKGLLLVYQSNLVCSGGLFPFFSKPDILLN